MNASRPLHGLMLLAAVALPFSSGCNIVGPLGFFLSPPQIQKAEVKATTGRLAIFVEYARGEEENPVFTQAYLERLRELLREKKVNDKVVPFTELVSLEQNNPDFRSWKIQRVGREVNAEQVLYVRVARLVLLPRRDHPLIEPSAELHLKLISVVGDSKKARLWPPEQEHEGRVVLRARDPVEAGSPRATDEQATKLARDAAFLSAMPFYDVDKEAKIPWEK